MRALGPPRAAVALLLASGIVATTAGPCRAHAVGVSSGRYRSDGASLASELTLARTELLGALPELDPDRDGALSADELGRGRPWLAAWIARGVEVRSDAGPCAGSLLSAETTGGDGVALRAMHRCAPGSPPTSVRLALLSDLSLGHRHLAEASTVGDATAGDAAADAAAGDAAAGDAAAATRTVLNEARPELPLPRHGSASSPAQSHADVVRSLFGLGVEHIVTGYDHLLFLLALVVVGAPLRSLLAVVTAFTVAHSITLALAALDLWAPRPSLVEPAIALSIAYVGVENFFVRDASRRWRLTFLFGLVHGFGFAGALREVTLPSAQLPVALASFNVGVEAGQLAVLALVLPAITWLGRRSWFRATGLAAINAAIATAGIGWLALRLQAQP